ncbi:MAG: HIT domain-containing protein [Candidatus Symbiodolus clandestinus]
MTENSLFMQIVQRQCPADIVYQDEQVTAFRDIAPQAPVHLLIVPNHVIKTLNDLQTTDVNLVGQMILVATQLAQQEGISEAGYRLIINCNQHGGQLVPHLHLHLVGGHPLGPMLSN